MENIRIEKQLKWLKKDEEIIEDLNILQSCFNALGLPFSLEECFHIWVQYSEFLNANWIVTTSDLHEVIPFLSKILIKKDKTLISDDEKRLYNIIYNFQLENHNEILIRTNKTLAHIQKTSNKSSIYFEFIPILKKSIEQESNRDIILEIYNEFKLENAISLEEFSKNIIIKKE